ncbi:hypothetical protein [Streptomyces lydicus]|uniref:hypothetical protein n=1 Tax=Streptomyces lydicus TaxID=47763 RepID=UPI00378BA055
MTTATWYLSGSDCRTSLGVRCAISEAKESTETCPTPSGIIAIRAPKVAVSRT